MSTCRHRSSNTSPDPPTRSFTVLETSVSPVRIRLAPPISSRRLSATESLFCCRSRVVAPTGSVRKPARQGPVRLSSKSLDSWPRSEVPRTSAASPVKAPAESARDRLPAGRSSTAQRNAGESTTETISGSGREGRRRSARGSASGGASSRDGSAPAVVRSLSNRK